MKQLAPNAVWLFFINLVFQSIIPVIILSFTVTNFFSVRKEILDNAIEPAISSPNWFLIIPGFLIICFIWAKLKYYFYRYELTEAGFRKELGIISKKYVTIPDDRIQNVDIYRGLLSRILGLSDLNIQTAGMSTPFSMGGAGGGSEGRLPALSRQDAELLRDELIQRARSAKSPGL